MGFLNKIFGDKVKVPKFKEIDPDAEIQKAFDSIKEQLPEAQQLTRNISEADADTQMAVLEKIAPGTAENIRLQTKNIQAGLRGELPEDVRNLIIDRSAIQSQFGGYSGSQAAGYNQLRNLGLTSLDVIDNASNQAAQALAQYSSMVSTTSVNNMFISPQQRYNIAVSERDKRYSRDMTAAEVAAQADPVTKGMAQVAAKVAGSAIGAAVGGPAGAQMGSQMGGSMFGGGGGGGGGGGIPYRPSYTLPYNYDGPRTGGSGQKPPGFWRSFLGNIGQSMG